MVKFNGQPEEKKVSARDTRRRPAPKEFRTEKRPRMKAQGDSNKEDEANNHDANASQCRRHTGMIT